MKYYRLAQKKKNQQQGQDPYPTIKYNFEQIARKYRAGTTYTDEAKRLLSQPRKENYTEERKKRDFCSIK